MHFWGIKFVYVRINDYLCIKKVKRIGISQLLMLLPGELLSSEDFPTSLIE